MWAARDFVVLLDGRRGHGRVANNDAHPVLRGSRTSESLEDALLDCALRTAVIRSRARASAGRRRQRLEARRRPCRAGTVGRRPSSARRKRRRGRPSGSSRARSRRGTSGSGGGGGGKRPQTKKANRGGGPGNHKSCR